ncbi:MAG: hypothetical protein P1P76_04370 [Anaerolineales bacterium]|nr:hypothetical protein [Anaerolineales bacterium]
MSSKYDSLARVLAQKDQDMIRMTFEEVEDAIRGKLPPAALEHRAWWANSTSHSHARLGWMKAGYHTSEVDLDKQELVFVRSVEPLFERIASSKEHLSRPRLFQSRIEPGRERVEDLVRMAGGPGNLREIVHAIQEYIDGDILETELGRRLRKLWPRNY